ncbi:MAG: MSMEG_0569 family flavin-dependent oxidoreductase [Mycobacteriales bacterium]
MSSLEGAHLPVVVVGAGQAGLSASWHLTQRAIPHLVLESHRLAHEWRSARWDSFCLVTPNWQCQLPGFPYAGDDPDGFMVKVEIVAYLEAYAASFDPPLHEGVTVTAMRRRSDGALELVTTAGLLSTDNVIVATGGYQVPVVPAYAGRLPSSITQVHSKNYLHPYQLPAGEVLVVGSGQSGAQIAEDLHLAGRKVHLALGDAPRVARRYRGRDVVAWLEDMGYYRTTADQRTTRDGEEARANHYVTGRDGGHDIDLRVFATQGMHLYGRLNDYVDGELVFRQDLRRSLDRADEVSEAIKDGIDKFIAEQGIEAPSEPKYVPPWQPDVEPTTLALSGSRITSVVWAVGLRAEHSWVSLPVLTDTGAPNHVRGVTAEPGLYFLGLPWQWTWGSARFSGVGADAAYLVDEICARAPLAQSSR